MGTSDEPMNYNASNGTITVTAATVASSDSKLSGLSVQAVTSNGDSSNVVYTPSFSPDVTEYKADLASNVTKLVIATTLSDSKSQTAVWRICRGLQRMQNRHFSDGRCMHADRRWFVRRQYHRKYQHRILPAQFVPKHRAVSGSKPSKHHEPVRCPILPLAADSCKQQCDA